MLNLDFLTKFYSNLVHYLNQLFGTKTPCVFFLSNEYHYFWKDWYNGKEYHVSLSDAEEHKEEHDINKIKITDFKVKLTKSNF